MRIVSDRFAAGIAEGAAVAAEAVLYDPLGAEVGPLELAEGSVTFDANAASLAQCSLTLAPDPAMVPSVPADALSPYGAEVAVRRGIRYIDGTTELVPLGRFRIDEVTGADSGGQLPITISAIDRSQILIDAVFEDAGQTPQGTDIITEIQRIASEGWGSVAFTDAWTTAPTATTPLLSWAAGDDRWDYMRGLAEAVGAVIYFDGNGELAIRTDPTGALTAVYTVAEGEGGMLVEATKTWGRADAVNRVVVTGANSSNDLPVIGERRDENPLSPTHYGGPFGKVTFAYSSDYITTDDQAGDVAATILGLKLGTSQTVSMQALANPALEVLDVIRVTRERIGVDELHIIDRIELSLTGLTGPTMQCATRAAQVSNPTVVL